MTAILPAGLVPIANQFIANQGGNGNTFLPDGTVNPGAILSLFFNQVEVSTNLTPTLLFPINAQGSAPNETMQALLNSLQPTVALSGPAGRVVVSPYGASRGAGSWWPVALIGGAVVLIGGYLVFGGRR